MSTKRTNSEQRCEGDWEANLRCEGDWEANFRFLCFLLSIYVINKRLAAIIEFASLGFQPQTVPIDYDADKNLEILDLKFLDRNQLFREQY